jgi:hypothetical protein
MKRLAVLLVLAACAEPTAPPQFDRARFTPSGSGQIYFEQSCASCHADKSGIDLAVFSYTDTNIVRRALGHVDSTKSWAIASYIATISTTHLAENAKVFQPGGSLISGGVTATGDNNFAIALFGSNAWPATLTRAQLLAIDPLTVKMALDFLPWSTEAPCYGLPNCNLEWMPKDSLPPAILSWNGNAAANALAGYQASETSSTLDTFILAVEEAATNTANSIAPCAYWSSKKNYSQCFEIRRWMGTLVAMRIHKGGAVSKRAYFVPWDAGDIARRSRGTGAEVVNSFQQWPRWMVVAWIFDPVTEPCVYTTGAVIAQSLKRHGVFICLRSIVARAPGDFAEDTSPYRDFLQFSSLTPSGTSWAYNAGKFALEELLARLNGGDVPPTSALRATATGQVNTGMANLQPKVTSGEYAILNALADLIRAELQ